MEKTFTESFVVKPGSCDLYGRMRPDALFIAMQEGGERHAISMGVGYNELIERNMFFALARIHFSTLRAPRVGETVIHTTWPGTANRFFFPRYHVFTLEDGTPLATSGALWVLLDLQARSIIRPGSAALAFPDNSDLPAPIELPLRLPALHGETRSFCRAPAYSDFDINGHVNNTRYISWLCDAIGKDAFRDRYIGDLIAGYEKEIRSDAPLHVNLSLNEDTFHFSLFSASGEKHFVAGGQLRKE